MKYDNLYTSVGVHPAGATRPFRFLKGDKVQANATKDQLLDEHFNKMKIVIRMSKKEKFIAVGKCGLDYNRLFCAEESVQKMVFKKHFQLARDLDLPMIFH